MRPVRCCATAWICWACRLPNGCDDMTAGDTQPTQPLPEWASAPPEPRRRHSAWPWIISIVIVMGLAVAAWFAAEWVARGIVERTIREQIITNLALPADQ